MDRGAIFFEEGSRPRSVRPRPPFLRAPTRNTFVWAFCRGANRARSTRSVSIEW